MTYRTMKQSQELGDKSLHVWSTGFQQGNPDNSLNKEKSFFNGTGKIGFSKEWS